jgi:hypothetical protein
MGRRVWKKQLQNLRTEIVLNDERDVAFWFSFSFSIARFSKRKPGKRSYFLTHQTQASLKALFPKRRECGEQDRFREERP